MHWPTLPIIQFAAGIVAAYAAKAIYPFILEGPFVEGEFPSALGIVIHPIDQPSCGVSDAGDGDCVQDRCCLPKQKDIASQTTASREACEAKAFACGARSVH
jgi:hypothetical protein